MGRPVDLFVFLKLFLYLFVCFPLGLLLISLVLSLTVAQTTHFPKNPGKFWGGVEGGRWVYRVNKLSKSLALASDQNTLMENRDIYIRTHITLLDSEMVSVDLQSGSDGKCESYWGTGGFELVVKTLGRPTDGRASSSVRCCKIRGFAKRDPAKLVTDYRLFRAAQIQTRFSKFPVANPWSPSRNNDSAHRSFKNHRRLREARIGFGPSVPLRFADATGTRLKGCGLKK